MLGGGKRLPAARPDGDRWPGAAGCGVDHPEDGPPPKAFLFVTKKEPKKSHRFRGGGRTTRANALDSFLGLPKDRPKKQGKPF